MASPVGQPPLADGGSAGWLLAGQLRPGEPLVTLAGGGCAGDLLMGVRGFVQAHIGNQLLQVALTQYNSGNFKYLLPQGVDDLTTFTSRGAYAKLAWSGWQDLRGILPGLGKGTEPGDFALKAVNRVINTAGDVRTTGIGRGESPLPELLRDVEGAGSKLEFLSKVGTVAAWAGILITGITAGISDYSAHQNIPRALGVGILHAGLSAAGAWAGGIAGGTIGSVFGPVGTVVGAGVGSALGAYVGDQFATGIVNWVDSGGAQSTYNTVTTALSNAGDTFSNGICAAENWGLSLFGM